MNLKQYTHQPDPGLFDTIQRRLRRRRALRMGGAAVAVLAVAGLAAGVHLNRSAAPDTLQQVASAPTLQPVAVQAVQPEDPSVAAVQPVPVIEAKPAIVAVPDEEVAVSPHPSHPSVAAVASQPLQASAEATVPVAAQPAEEQPRVPAVQPTAEPEAVATSTVDTLSAPSSTPAPASKSETDDHADLVWAPNAFIPDGDEEKNRTFSLSYSSSVSDFKIYIYNRGGRQVFHSTDPDFRWDGTFNGNRLSQGAYVWVARFRDSAGRPVQKNGTVVLLR